MRSVGMPAEAIEGMKATPFWAVMETGDASFPFMPAAAEAVAAALPNAKRKVLPGQGHGPAPEILAPVIAAFLRA